MNMRIQQWSSIILIVMLIFLGAFLVFDHRFLSWSSFSDKPMRGVYLYFPTLFFALLAVFKFPRGWSWSPKAFAAGLIATGLFHQSVVGMSYGNPGYMFPSGHILAPFVSLVAYTVSFILVRWFARNPRPDRDRG